MKLYVMKPVLTKVPVIWTARMATGLKPAKRKTPTRRIEAREFRKQLHEYMANDPLIKMLNRQMNQPKAEPTGQTVQFIRYKNCKAITEKGAEARVSHKRVRLFFLKHHFQKAFEEWCNVRMIYAYTEADVLEFMLQKGFIQGKKWLKWIDSLPDEQPSDRWNIRREALREGFIPPDALIGPTAKKSRK